MARENADHLLRRAREAGITDPRELANFMGQLQIESGDMPG
jgi:predicted chitinase